MLKYSFRHVGWIIGLLSLLSAEGADVAERATAARSGQASAGSTNGMVVGTIIDESLNAPVDSVEVNLKNSNGVAIQSTISDSQGRFSIGPVPSGNYTIDYHSLGAAVQSTAPFVLDAKHPRQDFTGLNVAGNVLKLDKFQVTSKQQAFLNAIDRKTYNVGKEIQSTTGSASDLLQNLPSVQVGIDGDVSLRGSENVLILINGRTSTLMGKTRAEALQQLPADLIDKIEVITNPSAMYKPDGTAGIINIVLKKKHAVGFSGSVNTAYGNEDRANVTVTAGYNPGPYQLTGAVSVRQDDRLRHASDRRTSVDPVTGVVSSVEKISVEHARPLTRIARFGGEYNAGEHDKLGLTASYDHRTFHRIATDHNVVRDGAGVVVSDYDRARDDPEYERSQEWATSWQHTFPAADHELNVEFKSSSTKEQEDNHYTNTYRLPVVAPSHDNTLIKSSEHGTESIFEYKRPLGEDAKLEAGYTRTTDSLDADFYGEALNPATGLWVKDQAKSNRFVVDSTINAFYLTYGQTFGKFGLLAGLRPELTQLTSTLVNTNQAIPNDYNRVYPTMHLAYQATEQHEFQLNYSHRVHRPESDDLNPFPEYQDPFNVRAGNPHLQPEDIHSVEAGYSFRQGDSSFTSTVYHRSTNNGFTAYTRDIGGGVLLTTRENLAVSRATGVELTANTEVGKKLSLNFSSNTFFNTIDASNLGFSSTKSDVSWTAKFGATLRLPANTLFQFNTNYTSTRLTPQGSRRPTFVGNVGLRHDFHQKKMAFVLTVSDLFNSLKETTVIDTPTLQGESTRRRSSRIIYLGLIYNFGQPAKKQKDDSLKFDNSL